MTSLLPRPAAQPPRRPARSASWCPDRDSVAQSRACLPVGPCVSKHHSPALGNGTLGRIATSPLFRWRCPSLSPHDCSEADRPTAGRPRQRDDGLRQKLMAYAASCGVVWLTRCPVHGWSQAGRRAVWPGLVGVVRQSGSALAANRQPSVRSFFQHSIKNVLATDA